MFAKDITVKDVFYTMLNIIHYQTKEQKTINLTEELKAVIKPERYEK